MTVVKQDNKTQTVRLQRANTHSPLLFLLQVRVHLPIKSICCVAVTIVTIITTGVGVQC